MSYSIACETATYFGPESTPLFGVVHMPDDGKVRGAVVICGSLGKDNSDNVRGLRLLGDGLAARNILALRFDYLGCGDSSLGQVRPDSAANWQMSVQHAVDYASGMGIDDISAIGVRAGALILDSMLPQLTNVRRVVYWDPASSGRRFLREQTAFFKIAAGEDDVPDGVVSTIGARFSAEAAKDFSALRLRPAPDEHVSARLVISRANAPDTGVSALISEPRTESIPIDGFSECAQPTRLLPPVALDAVDAAVLWLDKHLPERRTHIAPAFADSARIAVDDSGTVIERIERIEPHGMFAIRTLPGNASDDARPVVMFFNNANNPHYGPNREWVELSRTVGLLGAEALRWDRRGAGESGTPSRDGTVFIYSDDGIADAQAAARHAKRGAQRLQLAGTCSGGWYSARGGSETHADSVVLVNELFWSYRIKKALQAPIQPGDDDVTDWEQSPRARMRRFVQSHLPLWAWHQLGRAGIAQAPEVLLSTLARGGTTTTVILCPADAALFQANRGDDALRRLSKSKHPPRYIEAAGGDHAGFHQSVFIELRRVVKDFVVSADDTAGALTAEQGH